MRVQPLATEGSVVRRTRAMARCSASSAAAEDAEATSNAPIQPMVVFMVFMPMVVFMNVLWGDPDAWRVIISPLPWRTDRRRAAPIPGGGRPHPRGDTLRWPREGG